MAITNINQLDLKATYSYADYLKWTFKERVELLKGFIHKMSPAPSRRHQDIAQSLNFEIASFLREKPCKVYFAPFDVRLSRKVKDENISTVVQPDICVICDLSKLDDRGCLGAPDLVIEILSPGNTEKEMKNKYELYEEAGVLEYWIVDPEHNSVLQFHLSNDSYVAGRPLTTSDTLESNALIGLKINVETIFKD